MTLQEYYVLTLRIWFLALDRVDGSTTRFREHHELLEAIRDGDADRAEAVVRHHIVGFERAIRACSEGPRGEGGATCAGVVLVRAPPAHGHAES